MPDDLAVVVVVHVFTEEPDVTGLSADRDEVARDLDQLAVLELPFLDDAGENAVDSFGVVEDGHRGRELDQIAVVLLFAFEHQRVARPEWEVVVGAGGAEIRAGILRGELGGVRRGQAGQDRAIHEGDNEEREEVVSHVDSFEGSSGLEGGTHTHIPADRPPSRLPPERIDIS